MTQRLRRHGNRWNRSRFDGEDAEPLGPLANLVDLMLVFACGLIVALIAMSDQLREQLVAEQLAETGAPEQQTIERGRELPHMPDSANSAGSGMTSIGKVYRDSETGKLILVSE